MRRSLIVLATCLTLACIGAQVRADSFTVQQWSLSAFVINYSTGQASQDFTVVQNPFHSSHIASLGVSASAASYDFDWAEQFGHFLIDSSQQAEGVPAWYLYAASSGSIYITPSEDLLLTIDASWTFDLPAWQMESAFGVSVVGANNHVQLFSQDVWSDPEWPGGLSDTVSINGEVILPAGETWMLGYGMHLRTEEGTQGLAATGSGYVDFEITPEPNTATLAALVLVAVSHRRRCLLK
jgi:hypothetical protein